MSLFLEYEKFQPDAGYEGQIPNTAEFHLVISILWSRLGIRQNTKLSIPDGCPPVREQNTKLPGRWTMQTKIGRSTVARLSQLFEADTAVGTERGARNLYSAVGLLAGILCGLGEQRGKLRRGVQQLSRPAGV